MNPVAWIPHSFGEVVLLSDLRLKLKFIGLEVETELLSSLKRRKTYGFAYRRCRYLKTRMCHLQNQSFHRQLSRG